MDESPPQLNVALRLEDNALEKWRTALHRFLTERLTSMPRSMFHMIADSVMSTTLENVVWAAELRSLVFQCCSRERHRPRSTSTRC